MSKYIDAEQLEKEIHKIINTNFNGVSPEINRRADTIFPVFCVNDDGRPFDVNYTKREAYKKGLVDAYKNVLLMINKFDLTCECL